MCRLTAIISSKENIVLGDIVTRPKLGIIYQSFNCHERIPRDEPRWAYEKSTLNGDGFGVGWYPSKDQILLLNDSKTPCLFTSLKPAWGDRNLRQIAEKTVSPLIFAHVRAAGPGSGPPTEANCHPFSYGRFMFMHNGVIGDWKRMRRELLKELQTEHAFDFAMENNPIDSVLLFALLIDQLDPKREDYSANELRSFMEQVIIKVCMTADRIRVEDVVYINCCVSDGVSVVASRFALGPFSERTVILRRVKAPLGSQMQDASDDEYVDQNEEVEIRRRPDCIQSLSLYFATGTRWIRSSGQNEYKMVHKDKRNHVCIITSEPLTDNREEWVPVPHNHLVVVTNRCDVLLQPLTPDILYSSQSPPTRNARLSEALDILAELPVSKVSFSPRHCLKLNSERAKLAAIARSLQSLERPALNILVPPVVFRQMESHNDNENCDPLSPAQWVAPSCMRPILDPLTRWNTPDSPKTGLKVPQIITCRRLLTQRTSAVLCMAELTFQGASYVFAGDEAGIISMWSLAMSTFIVQLPAHKGSVLALQSYVEKDREQLWLFSSSSDTTVCVWNISHILDQGALGYCKLLSPEIFLALRLRFEPIQGDVLSLVVHRCFPPGAFSNTDVPDDFLFMGYQSTLIGYLRIKGLFKLIGGCEHEVCISQRDMAVSKPDACPSCQVSENLRRNADGTLEVVLSTNTMNPSKMLSEKTCRLISQTSCMMANATAMALGMSINPCDEPYVYGIPAQKDAEGSSTTVSEFDQLMASSTTSCDQSEDAGESAVNADFSRALIDWFILTPQQSALQHHCGFIECLDVCDEYLISGGGDGLLLVWRNCRHVTTLCGHTGGVLALCCDTDVVYSGGRDHSIRVWDMTTMSCKQVLRKHTSDVMSLVLTPHLFLSASTTSEIYGWSRKWNEISCILRIDSALARPSVERAFLTHMLKLTDDTTLLSSGGDGLVGIWDISDMASSCSLEILDENETFDQLTGTFSNAIITNEETLVNSKLNSSGSSVDGTLRKVSVLLEQLIPLRSLSGSPTHLPECWRAAKFVETCLQDLGAETRLFPTSNATAPIVMGRFLRDAGKPTVILYSHYDVVPPGEATGRNRNLEVENRDRNNGPRNWSSSPWALTSINGYFRGRGVTDNKGPLAAQLVAVSELLDGNYDQDTYKQVMANGTGSHSVDDTHGLPLNVIFISEGEEESGSIGFDDFLASNIDILSDVSSAVFTNSYWLDDEHPCLVYGMRGVVDFKVSVIGASEMLGLHSGIHGGAVVEPLADLVGLLGALMDAQGIVAVPDFYTDVVQADTDSQRRHYTSTSESTAFDVFDIHKYREEIQNAGLRRSNSREILHRRWLEPVMSITEIWSPVQQASKEVGTNFRVLPSVATCNISIRLVPYQKTNDIVNKTTKYLENLFRERSSPNTLAIEFLRAHDWWQGDTSSPLFVSAAKAVEHVWGTKPLWIREGGTMPVIRQVQDLLQTSTIQIPIGQASDNAHLPNERLKFVNVIKVRKFCTSRYS